MSLSREEHKETMFIMIDSAIDAFNLAMTVEGYPKEVDHAKERYEAAKRFFQDERTSDLSDDDYYDKVDLILYDLKQATKPLK